MSLYSDLNEVLTPYAQKIKGLAAANDEIKADLEDLEDRVEALESGGGGSGLTEGIKTALLAIFQKVAYVDDDGESYYDDLHDALYPPAPPASLTGITAVYTQSDTVYDTDSLNDLKSDLVVTASYSGGSTSVVPSSEYTLSGSLTEGTSTITVSYGGKTATFNVTVTTAIIYELAQQTTFNGTSDYIDTELQLLASDTSFSIFIDFTAGTYSSDSAILHCIKETSTYPGLFLGERTNSGTQYFRHAYFASGSTTYFKAFDTNRHKYIITHEAGTTTLATWYYDGTTGSTSFGTNTISYTSITQTLLIGCYQNTSGTKGRFWNGTVHACKVWDRVLSADVIANLMGV